MSGWVSVGLRCGFRGFPWVLRSGFSGFYDWDCKIIFGFYGVGCTVFCGWIRFVLDGFPWVLQWVDDGNDGRYPVRGFDFFAMDCVGLVWFAIDCVGLIYCRYDFLSLDLFFFIFFFPI